MPRDRPSVRPGSAKRARVASGSFVRAVLLASVAVIAAAWAFNSWLSTPRRPMFVPVAAGDAGAAWGDAAVIPAPDLEVAPR